MDLFSEVARFVHIAFGGIGLLAFWIPVFARKGAVNHVRYGRVFVWSAYVVLAAAGLSLATRIVALIRSGTGPAEEPLLFAFIVFLGYLTFVTFVIVRHGMQVLKHKRDPASLRTLLNRTLASGAIAASVALVAYALVFSPPNRVVLYALSPIGFFNGIGILTYLRNAAATPRDWMVAHLGAMLGAGIAFHTAFAVFGASRLFDIGLTGGIAVIPWVAPTIIGIPAIALWSRHYQLKFGAAA